MEFFKLYILWLLFSTLSLSSFGQDSGESALSGEFSAEISFDQSDTQGLGDADTEGSVLDDLSGYIDMESIKPEILSLTGGFVLDDPAFEALLYTRADVATYRKKHSIVKQKIDITWKQYFDRLNLALRDQVSSQFRLGDFSSHAKHLYSLKDNLNDPSTYAKAFEKLGNGTASRLLSMQGSYGATPSSGAKHGTLQTLSRLEQSLLEMGLEPLKPEETPNHTPYSFLFDRKWLHSLKKPFVAKTPDQETKPEIKSEIKPEKKTGRLKRFLNRVGGSAPVLKARETLVPKAKEILARKAGETLVQGFKSKLPFFKKKSSQPDLSQATVKIEYRQNKEEQALIGMSHQKHDLIQEAQSLAINEVEDHYFLKKKINDIGDRAIEVAKLKNRLIKLQKEEADKERPVYFALNSKHASSKTHLKQVNNIIIANFNLSHGFKIPVPRAQWRSLLRRLPVSYLQQCSLGVGKVTEYLNSQTGVEAVNKWKWYRDRKNNYYRYATLPTVKFRNHSVSSLKTLGSLAGTRSDSQWVKLGSSLALHVYIEEIEEIYFPFVVDINPSNREFLDWAEREKKGLPFTIRLGPRSLRSENLKEGLRRNRLTHKTINAVKAYGDKNNFPVDAILNLRFYALGARNLCQMELIHLGQTRQTDRAVQGFRFTFGMDDLFAKDKELEHLPVSKALPDLDGNALSRTFSKLASSRDGHSDLLHIDARLMYEYGLNYLLSDLIKHKRNTGSF